MTLITNAGEIDTQMKCAIKRLDPNQTVWFHPEYITNVLSLALLKKQFRITYDSTKGGAFVVHRPDKENMYFHCYSNGLHLIECNIAQFAFIETVAENKKGYSARQIQDAQRAKDLITAIGCPSESEFKSIIRSGILKKL